MTSIMDCFTTPPSAAWWGPNWGALFVWVSYLRVSIRMGKATHRAWTLPCSNPATTGEQTGKRAAIGPFFL